MAIAVLLLFALLLLGAGGTLGVLFGLPWLAEENLLFATVREGTAKAIMRGKSFDRFIMSFEGYHLNDPSKPWFRNDKPEWEVIYHGKKNRNEYTDEATKDEFYDNRHWLLKKLGLYWVGWPWSSSVYIYDFEWNETHTGPDGKDKVFPRSEATDFIFIADFTYAVITSGAETKEKLPVDMLTLATVAIRNPYRALFSGEDWMRRITASINRLSKDFVGTNTYDELISPETPSAESTIPAKEGRDKVRNKYSDPIIKLNEELPDDVPAEPPHGLKGRYGVVIRTADLQTIDLAGKGKESLDDATTKAYVAQQEAAAIRTKGQAEADVVVMNGDAQAKALEVRMKQIATDKETGALLVQMDAMQASAAGNGNTVIWANNPLIPLAAGLTSIAQPERR